MKLLETNNVTVIKSFPSWRGKKKKNQGLECMDTVYIKKIIL